MKQDNRAIKMFLISFMILCIFQLIFEKNGESTPLFSMQSAGSCNTCHIEPVPSDPKWQEENYALSDRKCRLSCGVCHVNPSGGMLRNKTGLYYGINQLPMMRPEKDKISAFLDRTLINDFLSVGGDFRFMVLTEEERDKNPIYFPMQADLYFGADLLRHLNVFTQFGMQRGGNPTVREAGAILGDFPFNSYCKIGKFVPPYGHRLEDHTAFIRSEIDFDHSKPETYTTGVEVGSEPLLLFWNLSAYNADATPSQNSEETTARGYSATAGWRGLWLHLGASAINNQKNDIGVDSITDRTAYGVFGALRFKKLIYLFEFDRRKDEIHHTDGAATDLYADITFNELDLTVYQGINLKFRYETFDPDKQSEENEVERYIAGLDLHPYPHTEINLQYRYNCEENAKDNQQFLFLSHMWF